MNDTQPSFLAPVPGVPADNRIRGGSRIEWLPVSAITRDERVNTRPVDERWVARRRADFNWNALGILYVSRRPDGTVVVIDGQHRKALAEAVAGPGAELKCEVQEGLTLADEARLFRELNDSRRVTAVYIHKSEVTQGIEDAVSVENIAAGAGWAIDARPGPRVLGCVSRLRQLHAADRKTSPPGTPLRALADTLTTLSRIWPGQAQAGDQALVWGLGRVVLTHGDLIRATRIRRGNGQLPGLDHLVVRLAETHTSPELLLATAKSRAQILQKTTATVVVEEIAALYNRGLPKRQHIDAEAAVRGIRKAPPTRARRTAKQT